MALAGLLAMLRWLPPGVAQAASGKASTQLAALGERHILAMMAVTTLGFGSIFAAFTYVTPILTDIAGFSASTASALLIVFGAATFAGNMAGGYLSSHMGWQRSLRMLLVLLALTHAGLALALAQRFSWLTMGPPVPPVAFEYSVAAAAVSAAQDGTAAAVIDSASIND
eukprot:gene32032-36162_t